MVKLAKGHPRGWFNISINNPIVKCCVAAFEGTGGCKYNELLQRRERNFLPSNTSAEGK